MGLAAVDERGRVYNNLTCLWSRFRSCLRLDGQKLVNVDIANSQPVFLSLLLKQKEQECSSSVIFPPLHKDTGFSVAEDKSKHLFGYLVERGILYNHIGVKAQEAGMALNRKRIKPRIFQVLYGKNSSHNEFKVLFSEMFPSVAMAIHQIKEGNYKRLPLMMQRLESDFIIRTVCKRLTEERPEIPLLTIHDSILTTEAQALTVKQIMLQEFKGLGVQPLIRME